jgi:peptidoglycan-N-acetylglucosamine deacetylase
MLISRPPFVLQVLFPSLLWRVKTSGNDVYLTFDDGPIPEVTPWVLDVLAEHKIKATFFCVGANVQKYPELYKRIINDGHAVGNHTFNHLRYFNEKVDSYCANIEKGAEYIKSSLFRPPHGQISRRLIKRIKHTYKVVMWDVLTADYDPLRTGMQCFTTVKRKVRPGSIIVFHDSIKAEKNMKEALPLTIEYLKNKDWNFRKITE